MLYPFPLRIPAGKKVLITQKYRSTELADFYKKQGLGITMHEAIDVVCGVDFETYGTPVVCPFPSARRDRGSFKGAMTDSNNFTQIEYTQSDGTKLLMIAVHLSEVVEKPTYKFGDVIGYVGNAGTVLPKPTLAHAYQGAHLHLAVQRNGVTDDPSKYFDVSSPFVGEDTGPDKDKPAADWVIAKILDLLKAFEQPHATN